NDHAGRAFAAEYGNRSDVADADGQALVGGWRRGGDRRRGSGGGGLLWRGGGRDWRGDRRQRFAGHQVFRLGHVLSARLLAGHRGARIGRIALIEVAQPHGGALGLVQVKNLELRQRKLSVAAVGGVRRKAQQILERLGGLGV